MEKDKNEDKQLIKVVILGFDGILFNTDIYHFLSWRKSLLNYGINIDQSYQYSTNGISREETLNVILNDFDVTLSDKQKQLVLLEKNEIFERLVSEISELECMPNILNFIDECKKEGIKIALSTSSRNSFNILEKTNLRSKFDYIINQDFVLETDTNRSDSFFKIFEELHEQWYKAIIISSSDVSIQAANDSLLRTISVGPSGFFKKSLIHVETTNELSIELLKNLEW